MFMPITSYSLIFSTKIGKVKLFALEKIKSSNMFILTSKISKKSSEKKTKNKSYYMFVDDSDSSVTSKSANTIANLETF